MSGTLHFDRIARPYRWLEYLTFGPALSHCRSHFLPRLSHCRRALILGDGDGRFTARLLATHPRLHADAVDVSPAMLRLLQQRAQAAHPTAGQRLQTHLADARTFRPMGRYDLVVTHFFLDCLSQSELNLITRRICEHLEPQALWVLSDFRIPSGLLRWPALAVVRTLYFAFRVLTGLRVRRLPDHATALRSAGLTPITEDRSLGGLLTRELWTDSIPHSGV